MLKSNESLNVNVADATTSQGGKPLDPDGLSLYSPMNNQVFQRQSRHVAQILVSGRSGIKCDRLECRLTGKPLDGDLHDGWTEIVVNPIDRTFFKRLSVPAGGWYKFEVRAQSDCVTVCTKSVEQVGVGEVFVTAGQSNSTNCGEFPSSQTSGMVSCFSGDCWQVKDDPFTGTHDDYTGGSPWPSFGDAMYERFGIPIGIASTGHGGSSVSQWTPGGDLFNWMMTRIYQLGVCGFRAVLWHQGESDVTCDPNWYFTRASELIIASNQTAGWSFPWFVALASYLNPQSPSSQQVRSAQKRLWRSGIALRGPDTDTLTGDHRDFNGDGIHFSLKGLKAHGELWAAQIGKYLDVVLDEP